MMAVSRTDCDGKSLDRGDFALHLTRLLIRGDKLGRMDRKGEQQNKGRGRMSRRRNNDEGDKQEESVGKWSKISVERAREEFSGSGTD